MSSAYLGMRQPTREEEHWYAQIRPFAEAVVAGYGVLEENVSMRLTALTRDKIYLLLMVARQAGPMESGGELQMAQKEKLQEYIDGEKALASKQTRKYIMKGTHWKKPRTAS